MEAILWALTTIIAILVLLVLLLSLLGVSAWLFRWVCRVWADVSDDRRS